MNASPQPVTDRHLRVLILESDRLIKALISEWLQMAGCEMLRSPDLASATADGRCDVVLADVRIPLKSARETVERVVQALPGTRVIAMSADIPDYGPTAADALARELGVDAVLVKPFTQETLVNTVRRLHG
jgi:DNA-binding response OmpR family regulator